MKVILASASPRRQELLKMVVPNFTIVPADIDEEPLLNEKPQDYVERMAEQKAHTVSTENPQSLVIGCDTVVVLDQMILGKPKNRQEAQAMLKKLSGTTHQAMTSLSLKTPTESILHTETVAVSFYELSSEDIEKYLSYNEYQDKAGAYGIQGYGRLLVKKINGDYYSVVGLPIGFLNQYFKTLTK
ncbi:Maf family protein [Vagococcus sp.]|uniref:Maf family protein n=1 Tax=Vagococcus sp. TaxID=1933889 RepID=UPI003F9829D9